MFAWSAICIPVMFVNHMSVSQRSTAHAHATFPGDEEHPGPHQRLSHQTFFDLVHLIVAMVCHDPKHHHDISCSSGFLPSSAATIHAPVYDILISKASFTQPTHTHQAPSPTFPHFQHFQHFYQPFQHRKYAACVIYFRIYQLSAIAQQTVPHLRCHTSSTTPNKLHRQPFRMLRTSSSSLGTKNSRL